MQENNSQEVAPPSITIIKTYEFEMYRLWRSLPYYLKSPPRDKNGNKPTPAEFAEGMGIDDADILDLINLKTQQEFADRFDVARRTLWEWGKVIDTGDSMKPLQEWALKLARNVLMAMYNNALSSKSPVAAMDRANFLKFAGWVEKKELDIGLSNSLADYLKNVALKRQLNGNNPATIKPAS